MKRLLLSVLVVLVVLCGFGAGADADAKMLNKDVKDLCKPYKSMLAPRLCFDLYRFGEKKRFSSIVIVQALGEYSWRKACKTADAKKANRIDMLEALDSAHTHKCLLAFNRVLVAKQLAYHRYSSIPTSRPVVRRRVTPPVRRTVPAPRRDDDSASDDDEDGDDDSDSVTPPVRRTAPATRRRAKPARRRAPASRRRAKPARRTTPSPRRRVVQKKSSLAKRIQVQRVGDTCIVSGYNLREVVPASTLVRLPAFVNCVKAITEAEKQRRTDMLEHYNSQHSVQPQKPVHIFVTVQGSACKIRTRPNYHNLALAGYRGTSGRIAYRLLYVGYVRKANRLVIQAGPPIEGEDVGTRGLTIKVSMGLDEVRAVVDMHKQLIERQRSGGTSSPSGTSTTPSVVPSSVSPQARQAVMDLYRSLKRRVDYHDEAIRTNKAQQGARLDSIDKKVDGILVQIRLPYLRIEGIVSTRSWFMVARNQNTMEVHVPFTLSLGFRLSGKLFGDHDFAWYVYGTLLMDPIPIIFERLQGFGFSYSFGFMFEFKHRYALIAGVGGYEMVLREDPGNLSVANGGWSARPQVELGFRWRVWKFVFLQANIRYLYLVRFDKVAHGLGFDAGLTVGNF